jgi:hypothetical protein
MISGRAGPAQKAADGLGVGAPVDAEIGVERDGDQRHHHQGPHGRQADGDQADPENDVDKVEADLQQA